MSKMQNRADRIMAAATRINDRLDKEDMTDTKREALLRRLAEYQQYLENIKKFVMETVPAAPEGVEISPPTHLFEKLAQTPSGEA